MRQVELPPREEELFNAIGAGNTQRVDQLLQELSQNSAFNISRDIIVGYSPDEKYGPGGPTGEYTTDVHLETFLSTAVRKGHVDIVRLLLARNARVYRGTGHNEIYIEPLDICCPTSFFGSSYDSFQGTAEQRYAITKMLVQAGAEFDDQKDLLNKAVDRRDAEFVKFLLQRNVFKLDSNKLDRLRQLDLRGFSLEGDLSKQYIPDISQFKAALSAAGANLRNAIFSLEDLRETAHAIKPLPDINIFKDFLQKYNNADQSIMPKLKSLKDTLATKKPHYATPYLNVLNELLEQKSVKIKEFEERQAQQQAEQRQREEEALARSRATAKRKSDPQTKLSDFFGNNNKKKRDDNPPDDAPPKPGYQSSGQHGKR